MELHVCKESDYCMCSSTALEPNDNCPVHGFPYPLHCGICGRFVKQQLRFGFTEKQLKNMSSEQRESIENFWFPMNRCTYPKFISKEL